MKIGLNAWAFGYKESYERSLKCVKDAGFDGIELNMGVSGWITQESKEEHIYELRHKAEEAGLEIPSICSSLFWKYALSSYDENNRNKAISALKAQIRDAKLLGAKNVLCVPGFVGAGFDIGQVFQPLDDLGENLAGQIIEYGDAYKRTIDALRTVKAYAESHGIKIALENTGNKFLLSPLEMAGFIDDLGNDPFYAYFDVGNVHSIGYPEHWIKILDERIAMIHLKDFEKSAGKYVRIGKGDLGLKSIIRTLRNIHYDGWLIVEYMAPDDCQKFSYLKDTASYIRDVINEV